MSNQQHVLIVGAVAVALVLAVTVVLVVSPLGRGRGERTADPDLTQFAIGTLMANGTERSIQLAQEIDRGRQRRVAPAEERPIKQLSPSQSGWTVPWAMWLDSERNVWLHPDYPVHSSPGGTVTMRVQRRVDGMHVWVNVEDYEPRRYHGYVSPDDTPWIPVVRLHPKGEQ